MSPPIPSTKLKAFGFQVDTIDGHDFGQIDRLAGGQRPVRASPPPS